MVAARQATGAVPREPVRGSRILLPGRALHEPQLWTSSATQRMNPFDGVTTTISRCCATLRPLQGKHGAEARDAPHPWFTMVFEGFFSFPSVQ